MGVIVMWWRVAIKRKIRKKMRLRAFCVTMFPCTGGKTLQSLFCQTGDAQEPPEQKEPIQPGRLFVLQFTEKM